MVLRRIEVPLGIRLDRLHLVIQAAMGWTDSHLYEIRAGDAGWGVPDPDWGRGPLDARKARLVDVLEDVGVKTLQYLYDFGDGWEHTIKIERIADRRAATSTYPRLIEVTGRCPPEDIGGPRAMRSSSKQSLTPSTCAMQSYANGSAMPSIPMPSTPRTSPCPRGPRHAVVAKARRHPQASHLPAVLTGGLRFIPRGLHRGWRHRRPRKTQLPFERRALRHA